MVLLYRTLLSIKKKQHDYKCDCLKKRGIFSLHFLFHLHLTSAWRACKLDYKPKSSLLCRRENYRKVKERGDPSGQQQGNRLSSLESLLVITKQPNAHWRQWTGSNSFTAMTAGSIYKHCISNAIQTV